MLLANGPQQGGLEANPIAIALRIISWIAFIVIALLLLKKKKMTEKNALILVGFSVVINGFLLGILGSFPNPVVPIQKIALGQFNVTYLVIIILLLVVSFIFGRIFCGYACPVGATQEILWRIKEKLWKKKLTITISWKFAQIFRIGVFIIMIILGLVVVPAIGLFSIFNPFHFFTFSDFTLSLTFILSLILFTLSLFIYRPFCRLFCPFGLISDIASRLNPKGTHLFRAEGCTHCNACEKACVAGDYFNAKNHGECYLCGRCIEKCPTDKLEYQIKIKNNPQSPSQAKNQNEPKKMDK